MNNDYGYVKTLISYRELQLAIVDSLIGGLLLFAFLLVGIGLIYMLG